MTSLEKAELRLKILNSQLEILISEHEIEKEILIQKIGKHCQWIGELRLQEKVYAKEAGND